MVKMYVCVHLRNVTNIIIYWFLIGCNSSKNVSYMKVGHAVWATIEPTQMTSLISSADKCTGKFSHRVNHYIIFFWMHLLAVKRLKYTSSFFISKEKKLNNWEETVLSFWAKEVIVKNYFLTSWESSRSFLDAKELR